MSKKKKRYSNSVNSALLQKSIRKCWPIFLLPLMIAFAIGFIYPFFSDYKEAFKDKTFTHAFWYTALFAIVSLVIINVVAFAIAYVLTQGIRGTNIFRTVFFMPNLIGGMVLGYIWNMIFNGILLKFNTNLLAKSKYGFWGLIIVICWQQIGYMMIIYIAGLQAVPEDIMEAAKIDGAGRMQTLFKVTIPNITRPLDHC